MESWATMQNYRSFSVFVLIITVFLQVPILQVPCDFNHDIFCPFFFLSFFLVRRCVTTLLISPCAPCVTEHVISGASVRPVARPERRTSLTILPLSSSPSSCPCGVSLRVCVCVWERGVCVCVLICTRSRPLIFRNLSSSKQQANEGQEVRVSS